MRNTVFNAISRVILLTVIGLAPSANAATGIHVQSSLAYQTHLGLRHGYVLRIEGLPAKELKASINGITLLKNIYLGRPWDLQIALSTDRNYSFERCEEGFYVHEVKSENLKKPKLERGCMDAPRFKTLLHAYRSLQD
jgi:hypothetical protein